MITPNTRKSERKYLPIYVSEAYGFIFFSIMIWLWKIFKIQSFQGNKQSLEKS